jgi:hypothetical protein
VEDETALLDYENVKYPLPDDDWYRYQAISDDILTMADLSTYDTYAELLASLQVDNAGRIPSAVATGFYKTMKVFHAVDCDTYFIVDRVFYDRWRDISYIFTPALLSSCAPECFQLYSFTSLGRCKRSRNLLNRMRRLFLPNSRRPGTPSFPNT